MNTFLMLAALASIGGGVAAPFAAVLIKSYKEERLRIESGEPPTYLPPIEQIYEPPSYQIPMEVNESKKALGLLPQMLTMEPQNPMVESLGSGDCLLSFDRARILNESKGLMIIGDMGAAKTCVAQYIANAFTNHQIIIFDPHGKTNWGDVTILTKMPAIYEQMRILLKLLEEGDETPLLIICDEWLEIKGDRLNKAGEYKGLAEDFIRLFSTKPRKFNKLAMFVLHSPNVEAAGVDSFLRENYLKIYLGRLAKKQFPSIKDCAYPCVMEDEQVEHPTHGHHQTFAPNGKSPRNLYPLNSAPITIQIAGKVTSIDPLTKEFMDVVSQRPREPLKTILNYCKEQTEPVTVRQIQRKDFAVLKSKSSADIRRYLGLLEDMGYGRLVESGGAVKFEIE